MADGFYHILGPGDDLVYLAELYYGSSAAWDHIYYANEEEIGDDPEALVAGAVVFVPALETAARVVKLQAGPEDRRLVEARVPQGRTKPLKPAYGGVVAFAGTEWRFEKYPRGEIPYAGRPASKYDTAAT
jgi:hypothetical protein